MDDFEKLNLRIAIIEIWMRGEISEIGASTLLFYSGMKYTDIYQFLHMHDQSSFWKRKQFNGGLKAWICWLIKR